MSPFARIARILMLIDEHPDRADAGYRLVDRIQTEHGIDMGHAEHWRAVMVHIPYSGITEV